MNNYQIFIDDDPVGDPKNEEEAAAWDGLLTISFPGSTIESRPVVCPECGESMPDSGPCWHNLFEEEYHPRPTLAEMMEKEAEIRARVETELHGRPISKQIPFQGEPMQPRIVTEADEYF